MTDGVVVRKEPEEQRITLPSQHGEKGEENEGGTLFNEAAVP